MSAFADKAKQRIAEDNQFAATLLNALDSYAISEINQNDLATSFQNVVVDVLVDKTIRAAKEYRVKEIMLAGGVSANKGLREKMMEEVKHLESVELSLPPMKCCTDNAMMIALAGKVMYDNNKFSDLSLGIKPHLDLELESIGGD